MYDLAIAVVEWDGSVVESRRWLERHGALSEAQLAEARGYLGAACGGARGYLAARPSQLVCCWGSAKFDFFRSAGRKAAEVVHTQMCSSCHHFHSTYGGNTNLIVLQVSHLSVEAALKAFLNVESGAISCARCNVTIVHRRAGVFRRLPIVLCLGVDRARVELGSLLHHRGSAGEGEGRVLIPGAARSRM